MHGEGFFLDAFWLLSTERPIGMDLGEIPWSKIIQYGLHKHFDDVMLDILVVVIREMDGKYLSWQRSESEKKARQSTKNQSTTE